MLSQGTLSANKQAIQRRSTLLGHTHSLATATSGLGVLTLHTQAPVMTQATMIPAGSSSNSGSNDRGSSSTAKAREGEHNT
jgi:hypothetical protein